MSRTPSPRSAAPTRTGPSSRSSARRRCLPSNSRHPPQRAKQSVTAFLADDRAQPVELPDHDRVTLSAADAVAVEGKLHQAFVDRRVNKPTYTSVRRRLLARSCRVSELKPPEGDRDVTPRLAQLAVQVVGGADQRQVREGLGEVAELLTRRPDLLGVQPDVVCVSAFSRRPAAPRRAAQPGRVPPPTRRSTSRRSLPRRRAHRATPRRCSGRQGCRRQAWR